jgi:hypothetical protein
MSTRLGSVLRIRKLQERQARGELAVARMGHRSALIAEQRTWAMLDQRTRAASGAGATGPAGPTGLLGVRAVVEVGTRAAATQHVTTEQRAGEVVVSLDHWTVAARRVEGLERLAARIDAAEREEAQRKVANEIDDLVLARFNRSDAPATGPAASDQPGGSR